MIASAYDINAKGGAADAWLMDVARWAWKVKLSLSLALDLMTEMRERAEEEAIRVFARNLKDLLLAAPAGSRATMGLDPGIRTGVKVAVVDGTGKLLDTATVYPFQPRNDVRGAQTEIAGLIRKHKVELIAIGNGTASRETDKLVADMIGLMPPPKPIKVVVSEAGASVYSASAAASAEFPDLDVSLRGAVSIARRLQDPLAELVKIEPKSIGVGQYQHDVDQHRLAKSLEAVVEDAVNAVGVDLNTASASLLARVSGLGASLAEAIVAHRDNVGPFKTRKELLKVARLGPKTFEQCAGFLRIPDGKEPLDASAVHPEAYGVAKKIVAACGRDLRALMGDSAALKALDPRVFVDEQFGLPTVQATSSPSWKSPAATRARNSRPRPSPTASRRSSDLRPGMLLEGTVTNVAAFGAFVDIGVHQDGLVHVSQLADRFVKDPHEVVKAGDVVKVRVVEVDMKRKRIALTMRKDGGGEARPAATGTPRDQVRGPMSEPSAGEGQGQVRRRRHGRVRRGAVGRHAAEIGRSREQRMKPKIAFSLIPGQGAMPIALGSTREQAGATLLQLGVSRSSRHGRQDYYLENAIQIEFTDERATFIGIYPHEDIALFYHGENILGMEAQKAFQLIARHEGTGGHAYCENEYLFPDQIITLWSADSQYDPSGADMVVWGQIGIGNAAYLAAVSKYHSKAKTQI